jgi:hypothetical protein
MKARDDPEYGKLFKVRPFVDSIIPSFREIEVEEYNSVDEFIAPFKGRSSLKQYVRNKPHKWGIKSCFEYCFRGKRREFFWTH